MIILAVLGAFFVGIVMGSLTMIFFEGMTRQAKINEAVMATLDWVERMYNRGRLEEAIAETRAYWNLKNAGG